MSWLFDIKYQLVFYGKYHSNKYNVAIHVCFVPIIMWTSFILLAALPVPSFIPSGTYIIAPYLYFQWSWAVPVVIVYVTYYFILEPVAALLYLPFLSIIFLSASPIAATAWGIKFATYLTTLGWLSQFAGHGFAEKRAPALLDNIIGALVLAPFFVHFEVLFACGYRPQFHREITKYVGVEVAKFRKARQNQATGRPNAL